MWTIPTLNTRETATVFWAVAALLLILGFLPGAADTVCRAFKTAIGARVRWLVLASLVYIGAVIYGLNAIGYWHTAMIGETAFWFLGGAALTLPRAISKAWLRPQAILRKLLVVSGGLEFLANVHTFLLPVELVLVPLLVLLDATLALVNAQPDLKEGKKPVAVLANGAVLTIVGLSVAYIAVHLTRFETPEYLRGLLLPLILTLSIAPLVYGLRLIILWDSALSMLKNTYLTDRPALYPYIRGRALRLCGLSLKRADLFEKDYWRRLRGAQDTDEVDGVLVHFESAARSDEPPETVKEGIKWDEVLGGGVNLRGFISWSIVLASQNQQELEKAATALNESVDSMTALKDRLDAQNSLASIGPIRRAQVIRILAESHRSIAEIELMVPEIGQLAVVEGVDPRWLAERFDAVMSAWDYSASESNAQAAELHTFASNTTLSLTDIIDASIALSKWDGTLPESLAQ